MQARLFQPTRAQKAIAAIVAPFCGHVKILNSLYAFLKLTAQDMTRTQKQCFKGMCFGLSVCHGAMDLLGKLTWWEALLKALGNWDKKLSSLDKPTVLPDAEEGLTPTLRQLFERAINYIIFHHAAIEKDFHITDMDQDNLLAPDTSQFEMIAADKTITTIKVKACAAGYLTHAAIEKLLDEDIAQHSIILVSSANHTIRVGFTNSRWIVYDPNYRMSDSSPLYKKMRSKKDLAQEIISILGHSINIEIASFKPYPNLFPCHLSTDSTLATKIMNKHGLHMVAQHTPQALDSLVQPLLKTRQGQCVITHGLMSKNANNWTGFHTLTRYAPESVKLIIEPLLQTEQGKEVISKLLCAKTSDHWTGFHILARNAPESMKLIIEPLLQTEQGKEVISKLLCAKTSDNWTGFHMLVRNAPGSVKLIIEPLLNTPLGKEKITEALIAILNDHSSGLYLVLLFCPQHFDALIEAAFTSSETAEKFAQRLIVKVDKNCLLETIAERSPNSLPTVFRIALMADRGNEYISEALELMRKESRRFSLYYKTKNIRDSMLPQTHINPLYRRISH